MKTLQIGQKTVITPNKHPTHPYPRKKEHLMPFAHLHVHTEYSLRELAGHFDEREKLSKLAEGIRGI